MGAAPLIISVAITAAQALSKGYADAQTQKNQANAYEYNARIAEQNANIAKSEGIIEEARAAEDAYRARGRLAAGQAQGGILGSVSGEAVANDYANAAKEDMFNIQFKNKLQTQGLLSEAANYRSQAKVARSNARQSILGGWLGGMGSVAGGAAKGYGNSMQVGSTS